MYGANIFPVSLKEAMYLAHKPQKQAEKIQTDKQFPKKKTQRKKLPNAAFDCSNPAVCSSQNAKIFYCQLCKSAGEKLKKLTA